MRGLLKIAVWVGLLVVVVFDVSAVVVNAIQLDDVAGSASRIARQTWEESGSRRAVENAVADRLDDEQDIALDALEITATEVVVTLSRPSRTLVAHRIAPLVRHVERTSTKRAELP